MNITELNRVIVPQMRHSWRAWFEAQASDEPAIVLIDRLPMRLYEFPWFLVYYDYPTHRLLHELSKNTVVTRVINPAPDRAYKALDKNERWDLRHDAVLEELEPQHAAAYAEWKAKIRQPLEVWLRMNYKPTHKRVYKGLS